MDATNLTQLSSREQLSALMDGALPADETRFLLRRLQHDASLAESWERWRLSAEVMRGLAPAQRLPADFASRVAASLRDEAERDEDQRHEERLHGATGNVSCDRYTHDASIGLAALGRWCGSGGVAGSGRIHESTRRRGISRQAVCCRRSDCRRNVAIACEQHPCDSVGARTRHASASGTRAGSGRHGPRIAERRAGIGCRRRRPTLAQQPP